MSRSSATTLRETPVDQTTPAATGALVVHGECFTVDTTERIELVDLTDKVMSYARQFGIREGTLTLWSMHTTCAVFINEFQAAWQKYGDGTAPGPAAAMGWASAKVFEAAARKAGNVSSASLIKALHTFKNETFGGLTVPMSYGPSGTSDSECAFFMKGAGGATGSVPDRARRPGRGGGQ